VSTTVPRAVTTNEQGEFRIPGLPPGRYTVKVEMDGFKPINMPEFNLLGGETRPLGRLTLTAGGVSESVTITAEVTPVQTATSQLTKNITGDTLVSVQVKGRDIFGMMKILPGVVDTTNSRDFAQWSSGRGLSINGGNSLNKNTTIDGVPVGEEGGDGTTHITPNIDAVGEVNVITSGYTAENGRQSSGLISIVTKSGTNQFRGSAWYNARRDEWNKNGFFDIKEGRAKPFFEVNISGYSIGGPVIIPKVMDSRTNTKKTYFFISQEFTDDLRPTSVSRSNLPTALERNGDFSQTILTTNSSTATAAPGGAPGTGAGLVQPIIDPITGKQFPNNRIDPSRFHPMGKAMLYLLPEPNGQTNPIAADRFSSNDARDVTPLHERKNLVTRIDQVINQNLRASFKMLFDRDDSITFNRVAPGIGSRNNVFPGDLLTGAVSQVLSPTMVNEITAGFSHNHFGYRVGKGKLVQSDYTSYYRENVINPVTGQPFGITNPPRLEPFGPYGEVKLSRYNLDEFPYMPDMLYSGGDRAGLSAWRPFQGEGRIGAVWNENYRYTFQDDLSVTKGRHNLKFGFFIERDSKTEPGSATYAGVYDFGHSADNPLSTGNGYANALLGVFTTYNELNDRLDRENRHWQSDAYAQDSWRINSRMTLDYGIRVTHAGAVYENRNQNSGFDPDLWDPAQAAKLYTPYCLTNVPGNVACSTANRRAKNPVNGEIVSQAFAGNTVPNTGSITNGMFRNGLAHTPDPTDLRDVKDGWYYDMPGLSWGPRVGFAWDVFGDGKTAIRASGGIFYNFINRSQYGHDGGPLISRTRTVRNATIDDVAAFAAAGTAFAESPAGSRVVAGEAITLYGQQTPQGTFEPEKNYQANVAVQRDIGFNTVAEVAWVTNIGRHFWRSKTTNNIPINAYADPANLFNTEAISANFLRRDYPGMGSLTYLQTNEDILNYNAMQVSVQRRLTKGLQMGLAYTLSKAEGIQGWDFATEELGGRQALRDRYYGPPSASQNQDRRHILVINYSYQIPNPTPTLAILKHILANWEASGVTQFTSGEAVTPTCNTNQSGVANTDPSLTGVAIRCELTGEPLNSGYVVDTSLPEEDRAHFNLAALQRPIPNGAIGNFGNSGVGILRNPGWQNWDFTLARRIPVKVGRGGSVRVQFQLYNMWNMVEFREMDATQRFTTSQGTVNDRTSSGKYTAATNPFNGGITIRFDY
jgi:hypothetical protein